MSNITHLHARPCYQAAYKHERRAQTSLAFPRAYQISHNACKQLLKQFRAVSVFSGIRAKNGSPSQKAGILIHVQYHIVSGKTKLQAGMAVIFLDTSPSDLTAKYAEKQAWHKGCHNIRYETPNTEVQMEQPTVEVKIQVNDDTVVYGIGHTLDEAWDNAYWEMVEWIARKESQTA